MEQVFWNLILNGLQAMPRGGQLTIRSIRSGKNVEVEVRDTGCGIREEDLAKIQEPFFTKREGGTGLGLSIACKIIQAHGGSIDVQSDLGGGTSVQVRLPL